MLSILKLVCFFCQFLWLNCVEDWMLPVFPTVPPPIQLGKNVSIPRRLWVSVKDRLDGLGNHMVALFARNPGWEVHVSSDAMKDEFMNSTFAGTSYLWAYHKIDSCAETAKEDLWRFAVLWAYGGVYIDAASDIGTPLDNVVAPEDTLIVSFERSEFNANRCYIPTYKLSDSMAYKNESNRELNIFHHRYLSNWAMMAAPRHKMIEQSMMNAVEIIRHEYHQDSVMRRLHGAKWEDVMCGTGSSLLTASLREVILSGAPNVTYRLTYSGFREYGGRFKVVHGIAKGGDRSRTACKFLWDYLPERPVSADQLRAWQGHPIQGQTGKEIFVVDNLTKRAIPDYDTFLALNYSLDRVIVIKDSKIESIETGLPLSSLMGKISLPEQSKQQQLKNVSAAPPASQVIQALVVAMMVCLCLFLVVVSGEYFCLVVIGLLRYISEFGEQ